MLKRISDWLHRISTRPVAVGTCVAFLLFATLVMPAQKVRSEAFASGAGLPDTSFWYSTDDLYRMADAYGEQGRSSYVAARLTVDMAWPLVYGAFLVAGIGWTFRKAFAAGSLWLRANLVPVLGVLLDVLENAGASVVMLRYPARTPVVDHLLCWMTPVKWTVVAGSMALLLVGMAVTLLRKIAGR